MVFVCVLVTPVFGESVHKANVSVELLSDVMSIVPGQTFWIGLRMVMDEGWHTYWRNSGDSGLPTYIQWDLPEGFGAGDIQWPIPKRFDYSEGLAGYGYDGEVILLTELWPPDELPMGEDFQINAQVRWLSCKEICVPGSAFFSVRFYTKSGEVQVDEYAHQLFMEEKRRWPVVTEDWQFTAFDDGDAYFLNISPDEENKGLITGLAFFPYRNDIIEHSARQKFDHAKGDYQLTIPKSVMLDKTISKIQGILVAQYGPESGQKERAIFFDAPLYE
jgi:thiol:disulfide interchange protein DsbD